MHTAQPDPNTLLSLDEIAERLRISRPTLERMRAAKTFPPVVALSQRRRGVLLRDFLTWIESRKETA